MAEVAEGGEETGVASEAEEHVEDVLEVEAGAVVGAEEAPEVGAVVKKEEMMESPHRVATSLQKQSEDALLFCSLYRIDSELELRRPRYSSQCCSRIEIHVSVR